MIRVFLILLISASLWGQNFEDIVNFNINLSDLSEESVINQLTKTRQIVILEGIFRESFILDNGLTKEVWITLMNGEWIGTDEVVSYSCEIRFGNEESIALFSSLNSDKSAENTINQGERMLIAGKVIGVNQSLNVPQVDMISYRLLQ